jgi:hypothetical protein
MDVVDSAAGGPSQPTQPPGEPIVVRCQRAGKRAHEMPPMSSGTATHECHLDCQALVVTVRSSANQAAHNLRRTDGTTHPLIGVCEHGQRHVSASLASLLRGLAQVGRSCREERINRRLVKRSVLAAS